MKLGELKVALNTVLSGGTKSIPYLLHDRFSTDLAAGAVNGTAAEPGPGTRTVVDVDNTRVKILTGQLNVKGNTGWNTGGLWYSAPAVVRASGKTLMLALTNPASAVSVEIGFDSDTASRLAGEFFGLSGTSLRVNGSAIDGAGASLSTVYEVAIVLHAAANKGAKFYIKGGTEYPDWCLVWVSNVDNTATYYVGGEVYQAVFFQIDDIRVASLDAPLNSDFTLVDYRDTSSSNGDTFTHSADAFIEHTITAATGVTQELMFRRTDDDNTWIIRCDQTNSKVYLYEKQGGVETERGASGGVAQTWTNGVTYRVSVRCHGTKILVSVGTTLKITYTTGAYNQTATGGKVSHAGANLIAWPVSNASALAQLHRMNGTPLTYGFGNFVYSSSIEA